MKATRVPLRIGAPVTIRLRSRVVLRGVLVGASEDDLELVDQAGRWRRVARDRVVAMHPGDNGG